MWHFDRSLTTLWAEKNLLSARRELKLDRTHFCPRRKNVHSKLGQFFVLSRLIAERYSIHVKWMLDQNRDQVCSACKYWGATRGVWTPLLAQTSWLFSSSILSSTMNAVCCFLCIRWIPYESTFKTLHSVSKRNRTNEAWSSSSLTFYCFMRSLSPPFACIATTRGKVDTHSCDKYSVSHGHSRRAQPSIEAMFTRTKCIRNRVEPGFFPTPSIDRWISLDFPCVSPHHNGNRGYAELSKSGKTTLTFTKKQ